MISLLLSLLFTFAQQPASKTQDEITAVKERPSELQGVPAGIARLLEQEGCSIPVVNYYGQKMTNVIHGKFAFSRQQDWAALCSRGGHNSIVVIWGGKQSCPAEFEKFADSVHLQKSASGAFEFDRALAMIKPAHLRRLMKQNGETVDFSIRHDAIVDIYLGKASVIHYCQAGTWKKLQGSD